MGKLTTYILILSTALLLFHFAGLIGDTPISFLLNSLLNPENLQNSSLFTQIGVGIAALGTIGIIIGAIAPQSSLWIIKGSIATILIIIGWDVLALINQVYLMNGEIALLLLSPFLVVYGVTVIEWLGGHD